MRSKIQFFKRGMLLLFCVFLGFSASGQHLEEAIDHLILSKIKDSEGPGGAFMVAQAGKPVYLKAFGQANLELGVPMETGLVFQIGSMTKQFTAVAILLLEQEGKLSIKDPISKYIPDYPNGGQITLHHLLTHTSGIKDFTKMKSLQQIANQEMSSRKMVDFFKDEPVGFLPGEKFDYNNSGYVVLGHIIEQVSSESYADFVENRIFNKIGMDNSYFATDRFLIPGRVDGYQLKDVGYVNRTVINFSVPFSSGSLMSTLEDLLKWQNALTEDSLLRDEVLQKAFVKHTLNNGEEFTYGYGWHLRELGGYPSREHGGSIFGFKSMGVFIPEKELYVVGLTNCDCISPTQLTLDIAALVLESIKD